jgi:flagellar biosynthetic protein FliR
VSQWSLMLQHVPAGLLVVVRIGGLMLYGPVFGSNVIPVRVKVFLAFLLGAACYPTLGAAHLERMQAMPGLWELVPLVALELLIGIVIGYVAALPLIAVQTGGLVMGQQMGLGFARFFNPAIEDEADVLGQILFFMVLAGFLLIGGHEAMLLAMLRSFEHLPPGHFAVNGDLLDMINGLLRSAFELALRVAAPVLALIFLQSAALGYISKTVPQLNILSLGFPLRIMVGILMITLGLVVINDVMMDGIDEMLAALFNWIDSTGG